MVALAASLARDVRQATTARYLSDQSPVDGSHFPEFSGRRRSAASEASPLYPILNVMNNGVANYFAVKWHARMWEISENLHRGGLTALEESEQIAQWINLAGHSAHNEPIENQRIDGRGHRPKSGINEAVRELGIERNKAQRTVRVGGLTPSLWRQILSGGNRMLQYRCKKPGS